MNSLVYILSGEKGSGKTTSLIKWSKGRKDVYGILTPVIEGQRFFMDVSTNRMFRMEAVSGEASYFIGRYKFSKTSFEEAIEVLRNNMNSKGWLIIDEAGPLELRGEGFAGVIKDLLAINNPDLNILLVVREGLTGDIIQYFHITDAKAFIL